MLWLLIQNIFRKLINLVYLLNEKKKKIKQKQKRSDLFFSFYKNLMYIYGLCSVFYNELFFAIIKNIVLCYGANEDKFSPSFFTINYIVQIIALFCNVYSYSDIRYNVFYFAWYIYVEFKLLKIAFKTILSYNKQFTVAIKEFFTEIRHKG